MVKIMVPTFFRGNELVPPGDFRGATSVNNHLLKILFPVLVNDKPFGILRQAFHTASELFHLKKRKEEINQSPDNDFSNVKGNAYIFACLGQSFLGGPVRLQGINFLWDLNIRRYVSPCSSGSWERRMVREVSANYSNFTRYCWYVSNWFAYIPAEVA